MSLELDGIDVDQYKTQAKELLRLVRAGNGPALQRVDKSHPRPGKQALKLADTQLVLAREQGFESWPQFQSYLRFRQAVRALDAGDISGLRNLLRVHPALLKYQCRLGEPYESGYFKGAMLLHHVAGNPIRCPLPANMVEVARLLLDCGADPDGATDDGGTTAGLLLTSRQSSEAGTAVPIIDMLVAAGARAKLGPGAVMAALTNSARGTAEELIRKGDAMDIRHAAALGRVEDMERLLAVGGSDSLLEEALVLAAFWDENRAARILVQNGAKGDVLVRPGMHAPQTALHNAASHGNREMVELLLNAGANATVRDGRWDGTPGDWAWHAGHLELAALLQLRSKEK